MSAATRPFSGSRRLLDACPAAYAGAMRITNPKARVRIWLMLARPIGKVRPSDLAALLDVCQPVVVGALRSLHFTNEPFYGYRDGYYYPTAMSLEALRSGADD